MDGRRTPSDPKTSLRRGEFKNLLNVGAYRVKGDREKGGGRKGMGERREGEG